MEENEQRNSYSVQLRPVHVDIRPRDSYQHHITVERAGDIISWSFFTRRKNLAFGLFFLHSHKPESRSDSPVKDASVGTSNTALEHLRNIREVIAASRENATIQPPSSPKPGQGSTSAPNSRANSVHPQAMQGRSTDDSDASESCSGSAVDGGSIVFTETSGSLHRVKTMESRPSSNSATTLEGMLKHNSSLPDLRSLNAPVSASAPNALEYIEILPIERYESFSHTITGQYVAPMVGTFVLYFDNSYSINTSKELFLTVTVGDSVPTVNNSFCGWLLKKKQRRMQGWARRWFQLDNKGILSYFEDRFSPCRGSMNLHDCVVTKSPTRLAFTIDSGRETYHLRAINEKDYAIWTDRISELLVQQALKHANLGIDLGQALPFNEAELIKYSEDLSEKLQTSGKLIHGLRDLAEREDNGNIKFVLPLERAFQSLSDLYESLGDYAVFLQRAGRRASYAGLSESNLSPNKAPASIDEFYDAHEFVMSEESEEEDMEGMDEFSISHDPASATPSEYASEFVDALEVGAPLSSESLVASESQPYRRRLARVAPPCNISLTSLLRKSIGKDWASIPMPVALNEPLSALQRMCEELEYSELLDKAALASSPMERMVLVAAFAISAYAPSVHRVERKPFTPILGETYEYVRPDRGYRFISEKVRHRPLILACHAQSERNWSLWQYQRAKNKNWGKSIEFTPVGTTHVFFADTGDHFVWSKVVTTLRNIIMGTKYVEHCGEMPMQNLRTGDRGTIVFKPSSSGFFSSKNSASNEVVGTLCNASDPEHLITLHGRWDSMLVKEDPSSEAELVWRAAPVPNDHMEYFGFTEFAISLNDLPAWLKPLLPATDSRFRPDQRMLEDGNLEDAEEVKLQVEQQQREHRQELEEAGVEWEPTWFKFCPPTADDPEGSWIIKDPAAYWESRRSGTWPAVHSLWKKPE